MSTPTPPDFEELLSHISDNVDGFHDSYKESLRNYVANLTPVEPLLRWLDEQILQDECATKLATGRGDLGALNFRRGHRAALLAVKQKLQGK